jgi:hypothetical protein
MHVSKRVSTEESMINFLVETVGSQERQLRRVYTKQDSKLNRLCHAEG